LNTHRKVRTIPVPDFDNHSRFLSKIKITDNCWVWTGSLASGYGSYGINGKTYRAHRISCAIFVGPLSDGKVLDHICENKACVNPDHLREVFQIENSHRYYFNKTGQSDPVKYCGKGHEYTEKNTMMTKKGRRCRECHNIQKRECYAKRKAI